jgi:hypothetical protein
MSVDTVFQPKGPTVLVTNASAIQAVGSGFTHLTGMVTFRVVNLAAATQRLGWGPTAANTASTGPAGAGVTNAVNSVVLESNGVEWFEFPATAFFIASSATGFEMTPGQGA